MRAYILTCINIFGPDCCMFESNCPVDKGTSSYQELWNSFKRITADEKRLLYRDTAAGFYRLYVSTPFRHPSALGHTHKEGDI